MEPYENSTFTDAWSVCVQCVCMHVYFRSINISVWDEHQGSQLSGSLWMCVYVHTCIVWEYYCSVLCTCKLLSMWVLYVSVYIQIHVCFTQPSFLPSQCHNALNCQNTQNTTSSDGTGLPLPLYSHLSFSLSHHLYLTLSFHPFMLPPLSLTVHLFLFLAVFLFLLPLVSHH